jgi:DNA mismatch repair ATPase MutS
MRNYDYWKKKKQTYNNEIILVLSGIFYRTFDADARVLSDCF